MILRLTTLVPLDLNSTLGCGQTFRWCNQDDWWYGVVKGEVFKIRQRGVDLEFENVKKDFIIGYFALSDDLTTILSGIRKDEHIGKAIDNCVGLRILHQEPWECLISYICATYKNIAAIKRMLLAMSRKFGEPIFFEGKDYHSFPSPERLAEAKLKDLAKCELGYRTKYVSQTAKKICREGFDLETLQDMPYEQAKDTLLEFPGVGQKVADCVLLFSLGKLEAFPIDVWVRRSLLRHYARDLPKDLVNKILKTNSLTDSQYTHLNRFARGYFGEYAGYAQEYLYHYERACPESQTHNP
jgi:N-glycosylase/DNA lyase